MKLSKLCLTTILTLILIFGMVVGVSAEYTYVQDDPDNATKFSIDKRFAEGFATDDLYIGTTKAYLGDRADGKTPIFKDGLAIHPADLLITNGEVGVVLAIGTADPWGYPGGSILDAGRVEMPAGSTDWQDATFGQDTVLTMQFLFNSWDAWAPVNCGMVYVDLVKYNFQTKQIDETNGTWAVQINRKFTVPNTTGGVNVQRDFDVMSYYTIDPGAEYACMFDTIINKGPDEVTSANRNQLSLSNKGGDGISTTTVAALTAANTYNWVAGDNGDPKRAFSTTFIAPGQNTDSNGVDHPFTSFSGAVGYREFNFANMNQKQGEERTYEGYLMIDEQCSWQNVYDFWADYKGLNTFNVSGTVKDANGVAAEYPVIVVYRDEEKIVEGVPQQVPVVYGWVMGDKNGNYSLDLPEENATQEYSLRVELTDTVTGSPCANFTSAADGSTIDLTAGVYKVPVTFNFKDADTGDPIWGRVMVGTSPVVAFTGKTYFLTDNSTTGEVEKDGYGPGTKDVVKGQVTAMVAPGNYSANCYAEGYNFSSYVAGATTSGSASTTGYLKITGDTTADPTQTIEAKFVHPTPENWYSIDNHHHGLRMDAFSEPEVVAKAQVTAGLDVLTLDDHEFVLDNWPVYQWGRKMDIIGYMPSEEVTASWAHFDTMPLSVDAYEQYLDRNQENKVVDTNQSLKGILDEGHLHGTSIGANHPTYSYGVLLADTNKTVPGGLIDDFDGLEAQNSANYTNEAMTYWTAFAQKGTHRNTEVKRPHYIWGSTDIHQSGSSAASGANRSYVFLEDGDAISAADFDTFGLEFARSQALGHSFVSNGVYIIPATEGLMYGETYETDANGNFTAKFDISAIDNITAVYVFSSLGNTTVSSSNSFNNYKYNYSIKTYTGAELTNNLEDFTVNLTGITGKEWIAIAATTATTGVATRNAFTNPIWINGPSVAEETITDVNFQNPPTLPSTLKAGDTIETPTSAGILVTTPWSVRMVEDWTLEGGNFGDAAVAGKTYTYKLTYTAPDGYVFAQALSDKDGFTVSSDGKTLVYAKKLTVPGGSVIPPGPGPDDGITIVDGMGTLNPTDDQWNEWIEEGDGSIVLDFTDNNAYDDMNSITVTINPDKVDGNDLEVILPDGTAVTVPADAWEAIKDAAGGAPVDLVLESKDDGSVEVSLKQGDKDIDRLDGAAALLLQIPYEVADGQDPKHVVAKKLGANGATIARSWYDETDKVVYAKIYSFGEYEPIYKTVTSFDDTVGDWMDTAVKYLRIRDVAEGVGDNKYEPNRSITRAEYTTLLMRVFDLEATDKVVNFPDTDIPDYAKDYINIAASHGFILGDENGYFLPNDNITRQDMFVITYRMMTAMDMIPANIPDTPVSFNDFDQTAPYAIEAIETFAKLKLINGDTDGNVTPTANSTRGECAQFIYNILLQDR